MTSVTFEGIKYSYNQRQAGIVIAFVVHPENMPDYVALAPLGSRVMVTLTEIGDDDKPVEKPAEKPRQSWESMSRAQQAGILCSRPDFQRWLGVEDEHGAAVQVRYACNVMSRGEIDKHPHACGKFDALVSRYRQATGQMAEVRG